MQVLVTLCTEFEIDPSILSYYFFFASPRLSIFFSFANYKLKSEIVSSKWHRLFTKAKIASQCVLFSLVRFGTIWSHSTADS